MSPQTQGSKLVSHCWVFSSQTLLVQTNWSLQLTGLPGSHMPASELHVSAPLQNRPSSQSASLATLSHSSVPSLHESAVHMTWSSHSISSPNSQPTPSVQTSTPLQ